MTKSDCVIFLIVQFGIFSWLFYKLFVWFCQIKYKKEILNLKRIGAMICVYYAYLDSLDIERKELLVHRSGPNDTDGKLKKFYKEYDTIENIHKKIVLLLQEDVNVIEKFLAVVKVNNPWGEIAQLPLFVPIFFAESKELQWWCFAVISVALICYIILAPLMIRALNKTYSSLVNREYIDENGINFDALFDMAKKPEIENAKDWGRRTKDSDYGQYHDHYLKEACWLEELKDAELLEFVRSDTFNNITDKVITSNKGIYVIPDNTVKYCFIPDTVIPYIEKFRCDWYQKNIA